VLSFEAAWNNLLDQIEQKGWAWQYVHADDGAGGYEPFPFYCYTVGLAAKGLPDLIVVGLNPRVATDAGDEIISRALQAGGQPFTLNTVLLDVFKNSRAMLVEVPKEHAANRSLFALDFAEATSRPLQVFQLLWPDQGGRLPFEDGADAAFVEVPPVLKHLPLPDPVQPDSPAMQ